MARIRCLLIANRGEIACRILRTARSMGMRTVAVYSEADAAALHVRQADEAICIGAAPAIDSYLKIDAIIDACRQAGADAVHPGYGFLSENPALAEACTEAGVRFVGPPAAAIHAMGSKIEAKKLAESAGAPVTPGYHGEDQDDAMLRRAAEDIGFPLLIKASAGGGGKGMRRVDALPEFEAQLASARREAAAAFGDDRVLLERYLARPRHLEVQILADTHGNCIALFERDCSIQRRHQKVIEEAPGPAVCEDLRQRLCTAAVSAASAVGYVGAGTVEFIAEGDAFYFMEMNTRLQVEHPVTEAITGLDLVAWQLRIAAGERLDLTPEINGHAIEARLYAENPGAGFLPSSGRLERLRFPKEVRVDTGVVEGDAVSVHYDPMLAKIIAWGPDRSVARDKLRAALSELEIIGVAHNAGYLRNLLDHPALVSGNYDTSLADANHAVLTKGAEDHHWALAALAIVQRNMGRDSDATPWGRGDGWRLNAPPLCRIRLSHDDECRTILMEGSRINIEGRHFPPHGLLDPRRAPAYGSGWPGLPLLAGLGRRSAIPDRGRRHLRLQEPAGRHRRRERGA